MGEMDINKEELFKKETFDYLIEKAVKEKCSISIDIYPDNFSVRFEPWKPVEMNCPYTKFDCNDGKDKIPNHVGLSIENLGLPIENLINLSFFSENDAKIFLDSMKNETNKHGFIRLDTVLQLCAKDIPEQYSFALHSFGWTSLNNAKIVRVKPTDYRLDLPKTVAI